MILAFSSSIEVSMLAQRQKNRDGLAWFARRASAWILSKVRERDVVRGQADEETCKSSENWKKSSPEDYEQVREPQSDYFILHI